MSSHRLLLDTSTLIFLTVKGSVIPAGLEAELDKSELYISAVTEIELFANPSLAPDEEKHLRAFLDQINIIDLSADIKKEATKLRRNTELTFPDCIIAATAVVQNAVLLTSDAVLLRLQWPGFKSKNTGKYK
jgi:predicted nucleic acid-binding protein